MSYTNYKTEIKDIKVINKKTKVFNFSVDVDETYYSNFVLSHNCSCKNRNKNMKMNANDILKALTVYKSIGCKAVTITGGGEPLMHKDINYLLESIYDLGLQIGLTTNGFLFNRVDNKLINKLTWCRISLSDEHELDTSKYEEKIKSSDVVNWSYSYVVTEKFNPYNLKKAIEFANEKKFTHVRIVDDILNERQNNAMNIIKNEMAKSNIDDSKVIYQGRKEYGKGSKMCLISLLKPNITANGFIVGCCGVQFAKNNYDLDFTDDFVMGNINQIKQIYDEQKYFDGSICKKCYYTAYNEFLEILWNSKNINHKNFV